MNGLHAIRTYNIFCKHEFTRLAYPILPDCVLLKMILLFAIFTPHR